MSWQTQKMWDRLNECRKQVLGGIQYFRNLFHFRSLCFFMIVAWILLCWTFVAINIPTDASALCFFKGIVLGHLVNIYNTLACVGLEEEHLFCRVIICYFFSQFMDGWINEWTYWAQSGALDTGHKTNTKQMTSVTPKQPGTQLSAEPQQIVTKQTIKCRHTCKENCANHHNRTRAIYKERAQTMGQHLLCRFQVRTHHLCTEVYRLQINCAEYYWQSVFCHALITWLSSYMFYLQCEK